MALTACACWKRSNRLAERQLRVQMLQGDGGPGKALDQARSMALSRLGRQPDLRLSLLRPLQ